MGFVLLCSVSSGMHSIDAAGERTVSCCIAQHLNCSVCANVAVGQRAVDQGSTAGSGSAEPALKLPVPVCPAGCCLSYTHQ